MPDALSSEQLITTVVALSKALDHLSVDYAVMGGAAIHILASPCRSTTDVDLVIQHSTISAEDLTSLLFKFSDEFTPVNQFGHIIPGYRAKTPDGDEQIVELEVFDQEAWPERPQYDLKTASKIIVELQDRKVNFFSPEWLFREKIRAAAGRPGTHRGDVDINDAARMLKMAKPYEAEMDFKGDEQLHAALNAFLLRMPDLNDLVRQKVKL